MKNEPQPDGCGRRATDRVPVRCTPTARRVGGLTFWRRRGRRCHPLYEKFVQLCRDKGFHTRDG